MSVPVFVCTRDGLVRLARDGATWAAEPVLAGVPSYCVAADGERVLAGSPWTELEALQDIPSRERWSFPPRPWTHHVRWIAPDPHDEQALLVGIELGGLMSSDDGGATFSDHRPGAKRDTHFVAWHPHAPGRAYQSAGDGAPWSDDGGGTRDPPPAPRRPR